MARHEFSKATKRAALKRSGGKCEAVGKRYGFEAGQICGWPLDQGVEFDHWPLPAHAEDSDKLENCVACCPTCHSYATRTQDIPREAKMKRVQDRHIGIKKPRSRLTHPTLKKKFDGTVVDRRTGRPV